MLKEIEYSELKPKEMLVNSGMIQRGGENWGAQNTERYGVQE